jgi:Flp pilus assembly pilin Flp
LPSTIQPLGRSEIGCEVGQTMVEYAVVLGVITLAIVTTLGLMSSTIQSLVNGVTSIFS